MKRKSLPAKPARNRARSNSRRRASARMFYPGVGRIIIHRARISWRRLKTELQRRLSELEPDQFRRLLLACGIACTAALMIIALSKNTALLILILAALGAAVMLKMWNRILSGGY
jgi:hypothetical protein